MSRIQGTQPYSNMPARRGVLVTGFILSVASLILVVMSFLLLFMPEINLIHSSPSVMLKWMLIVGISVAFIGTVFTVAGANTIKIMARFSMLFSTLSFIAGAALLVIVLLFRTILPIDAIERLGCILILM